MAGPKTVRAGRAGTSEHSQPPACKIQHRKPGTQWHRIQACRFLSGNSSTSWPPHSDRTGQAGTKGRSRSANTHIKARSVLEHVIMEKYKRMVVRAQEAFRRRLDQVEIELAEARNALEELEIQAQDHERRTALALGQDSEDSQLYSLPDELMLLIALEVEKK